MSDDERWSRELLHAWKADGWRRGPELRRFMHRYGRPSVNDARERRTRTDLRHLARRADRRRRRAIAACLAENRVPPGVYDLAGAVLTRATTASEIWRRR